MNDRLKFQCRTQNLYAVLGLIVGLFVVGCGRREPLKMPTTEVTGKVTFKIDRPAQDIAISGVNRRTGEGCLGKIEADGTCKLLFGTSPEIPQGTYDLALVADNKPLTREEGIKVTKGEMPPPKQLNLPPEFTDRSQTGWSVEVSGKTATFEITVGPLSPSVPN